MSSINKLVLGFLALLFLAFSPSSLAGDENLPIIRKAIQDRGAKWQADKTSVSNLSYPEKLKRLGLIPDPDSKSKPHMPKIGADGGGATSSNVSALNLPASLDYRNYNGLNFVTPVRNQGSCGSCWAFAATAAFESQVMLAGGQGLDLAEEILLSCNGGGGGCSGGQPGIAAYFIRDTGLPLESVAPYTASSGSCPSGWQADAHKADGAFMVWGSIDDVKTALKTFGPLITTMTVYEDFYSYRTGIYTHVSGASVGGHAVSIIGYDDNQQYFIAKNSWGAGWGEGGFFRISYNAGVGFGGDNHAYYSANALYPNLAAAVQSGTYIAQTMTSSIPWIFQGMPGSSVRVDLYQNSQFVSTLASDTPIGSAGTGSFKWLVPRSIPAGNGYQVLVTSNQNPIYFGFSNSFNIQTAPAASLQISSPANGAKWSRKKQQSINWNFQGIDGSQVKIVLLKTGSPVLTIANAAPMGSYLSGSFKWSIPSGVALGSDYQIQLTATDSVYGNIVGVSSGFFAITR